MTAHDSRGRIVGTRGLTDRQTAFVRAYTRNGGQAVAAADAAGYAHPASDGYHLMQNTGILAALHGERQRQIGRIAQAGIDLLERVILGTEPAPIKTRVDAAKTILDRAGHIAPKAGDAPSDAADAKRLEDMTVPEMEAFIRRSEEALRLARQPVIEGASIVPDDAQAVEVVDEATV